jgi:Uma2 family endonuclease
MRVDERTSCVPDAVVNCGEPIEDGAMTAPNPIIVVEVLSPSTRQIDKSAKLLDYFRVPGLIHYLIVDVARRAVIHHRRKADDAVETTLVRQGRIALDPPGIGVDTTALLG